MRYTRVKSTFRQDVWINDQGQRILIGDTVIFITKGKFSGWKTRKGIYLGHRVNEHGEITSHSIRTEKTRTVYWMQGIRYRYYYDMPADLRHKIDYSRKEETFQGVYPVMASSERIYRLDQQS